MKTFERVTLGTQFSDSPPPCRVLRGASDPTLSCILPTPRHTYISLLQRTFQRQDSAGDEQKGLTSHWSRKSSGHEGWELSRLHLPLFLLIQSQFCSSTRWRWFWPQRCTEKSAGGFWERHSPSSKYKVFCCPGFPAFECGCHTWSYGDSTVWTVERKEKELESCWYR